MKRILIIEHGRGFGGSTFSLLRMISRVDRKRFEPVVLADRTEFVENAVNDRGMAVIRCPDYAAEWFDDLPDIPLLAHVAYFLELLISVLPQTLRLAWIIKRRRPDIIHCNNNLRSQIAAIIAAKLCGLPCVVHLRNQRPLTRTEQLVARWVDRIVVLSEHAREIYGRQGIIPQKIRVLYDPILDVTTPDGRLPTRKALGIPLDVPAIGVLSRLTPAKGHEEFLRAASTVHEKFPQAKFLIVGRGNKGSEHFVNRLHRLVQQLKLEESVCFTGWRGDIPNILASLDIVVDPSKASEGTRLTVLEGMAMGRAVVATNVGAEAEFFEQGRGMLVAPGHPEELATAMLSLLENATAAQQMGEAARAYVLERCDPARSARALEQIYESVINSHGAPRAEPVAPPPAPVGRNPERAHGQRPWCESKGRSTQ